MTHDKADAPEPDEIEDSFKTALSSVPEPVMIHDIIREDGERELARSVSALAWSGFAAGLSMGFSFLMLAIIRAHLPDAPWRTLVSGFGYTTGFLIVVLGKQQLFTESTLTAVLPVLTEPKPGSIARMFRLWGVVLVTNVVGTFLFAWLLSAPGLFSEDVTRTLGEVGHEAVDSAFWAVAVKSVLAGWLIALMVWLMPSAGQSRLLLILIITYLVAIGHFSHLIAGSSEVAYLVLTHQLGLGDYVTRFFAPTFLGNVIGGTSLVALLNHAPVREELDGGKHKADRR